MQGRKICSKECGGKRDGELSQMIWGCFVGNKLGPIVFIDGTIRKELYIAILEIS